MSAQNPNRDNRTHYQRSAGSQGHRAAIREAQESIGYRPPFNNQTDSVCGGCKFNLSCREKLQTGELFPCQPQDQDASIYQSARLDSDFIGRLVEHGQTGCHRHRGDRAMTAL